jgi:cytochrome b561
VPTVGSSARYGAPAQAFHWATAVLVLTAFIISAGGPEARVYSAERAQQLQLHETLGLAVFALALIRLAWRAFDRTPSVPMPAWMHVAGRFVQALLYCLLVVVPLTAIVGAWLEGHPVTAIAIGPIGPWLPAGHQLGQAIAAAHSWLGDALMWLAGLHAAAGLFHHFVMRDRVLLAMLPWGAR